MLMPPTISADCLDSQQLSSRSSVKSAAASIELPTFAVAVAVYSSYVALTWFFCDLPLWIAAPLCALCLTWFGSLQHETIHGHPTPWKGFNRAIVSLPLSLWIPYRIYRVTHLQHHRHGGRHLTDAIEDPESFYHAYGVVSRYGALRRALYRANCTLIGRLTLGPALSVLRFWLCELHKFGAGDRWRAIVWARHLTASLLILWWIKWACHIPITEYVLLVIYPSISLTQLRSFAEHRADPDPALRTLAVECNFFWALLFLNNNLHIAHHAFPKLPWYQLPRVWRQMRQRALAMGLAFHGGYVEVSVRYLCRAVISVEHPCPARPASVND